MRKVLLSIVCCFVFAGCIRFIPPEEKPTDFVEPEVTSTTNATEITNTTETTSTEPAPTPTEEQKKQAEEVFKATCRKYDDNTYERLMREDTKEGTRVCLEVEVSQKIDSLLSSYYRVTGANYSWKEEYIIYDHRENDDTKILVGDVLTIYGEFNKLGEFERSLTGNTVEIPIINAKYIDFVGENSENNSVAKATSTPIPWVVEFNQSGEVFSEYNYNDELEGSVRIDGISYEFDDWGDLVISLQGQVIEKNDDFYICYKLYDKDDYVIDNGIISIDGLKSGDKFKNKQTTIFGVEEGNYRIELSDR